MAARAARLAHRNNDESSQSPGDNNDDGGEDNDPGLWFNYFLHAQSMLRHMISRF
jgi:hypothetical protein